MTEFAKNKSPKKFLNEKFSFYLPQLIYVTINALDKKKRTIIPFLPLPFVPSRQGSQKVMSGGQRVQQEDTHCLFVLKSLLAARLTLEEYTGLQLASILRLWVSRVLWKKGASSAQHDVIVKPGHGVYSPQMISQRLIMASLRNLNAQWGISISFPHVYALKVDTRILLLVQKRRPTSRLKTIPVMFPLKRQRMTYISYNYKARNQQMIFIDLSIACNTKNREKLCEIINRTKWMDKEAANFLMTLYDEMYY
ncbi:unnamed protein product [Paramecium sonneborni]|uniref:Uncharacterized protein n=1 Tax=Paramecium sonneborni TaxID=65129 RepID=A0A8S1LIK7_9CILI|nr:unnamed protein product [Paramecium sonneborni]